MAPSGEHRAEDLGQAPVRAASVAVGNAATSLRQQVKNLDSHASGQTVAKQCELLTEQAGIAEKTSSNLAIVADALKIREDAARAWNRDAPKDSEIKAAEEAVAAAKKKLQDASAASGDTSAASTELENAQKNLGLLLRRRREADKAYDKAEQRSEAKLAEITLTNSSTGNGIEGGAPTPGTSNGTGGTPAPSAGTGRPSGETGKRSDPSKSTAGTAKPAGTPSPTSSTTGNSSADTSSDPLAALIAAQAAQQQQPQPQAQQAQPAATTPTAATPQMPQNSQPAQDKKKETGTSPLDRILGSDGILDNTELTGLIGAPLTLGSGSTPTHSTPAAAVTSSSPAASAPSPTGLSAGTVTQPVTSGTSAANLNTATDVSGRPAEQQRTAFSVGPETKTSSATGTSGTTPAHATGTRPMGAGGMPMVPMGAMGGPGGGGAAKEKEQVTLASGSAESDLMHGRHAVAEAVPGGTIAQRDHPRRRPESDAA
ncbi:hypothetical protein [Mycobacteroides abscessus]|uniref:hypothetical protein n=1 Tax=Mycobacteroides abscessus TaxID=36809 RepID=UPI00092C6ED4|nr:hypothetical protein [Mycobacteroides abscessus]SIG33180.1 Uncharacterised protein [Mycobacteroides abscessus subsp. abscessus]SIG44647.1 Uncharacterised protein [Mycobacteroides abscessus subsp. abscessus]SIM97425.1 Uncharacterised protein [Mycobacteroides abscessus subsp. abscessus]SIN10228.1 Uncharacterised protein [Mycobacteroides abscessus subsp. abscessus]SIN15515.1 Uncharacterised protein [Mycobacteroides abscessus subsp. abscessus]